MICEHCGCVFCPALANPGTPPQRYCSENCGKYDSRNRTGRKAREQRWSRRRKSHQRSCPGKERHDDVAAAGAVLLRMRFQIEGFTGGVYECLACGKWHVTSNEVAGEPMLRSHAERYQP